MSYLIASDYNKQIQADNLSQVISGDVSILTAAELAAQEEITSYLTQKYDLSKEFTDTQAWDSTVIYKAGQRVTNSGLLYFAKLPAPLFDYTANYKKDDQVFWKDKVYTALHPTNPIDPSQYGYYSELPLANSFPDANTGQWNGGTAYSIPAGTVTTDATKWTLGDNRSQQMVMFMIDITLYHLHARISPRNIPDLRVKRFDEAVHWLEAAGKGKITANLPLRQVHSGSRIRFGGNVKHVNNY